MLNHYDFNNINTTINIIYSIIISYITYM